jgi:hypothetical protein
VLLLSVVETVASVSCQFLVLPDCHCADSAEWLLAADGGDVAAATAAAAASAWCLWLLCHLRSHLHSSDECRCSNPEEPLSGRGNYLWCCNVSRAAGSICNMPVPAGRIVPCM